ncbi:MAG: hypothetical protein V4469_04380 [Patescibacteria group bacterium]
MSIQFNQAKYGIVQRARKRARVDSVQWPIENVANSCNDWLDFIVQAGIGLDKEFQFDDINHLRLPEGTTPLVSGQSDYSFLVDEQSNPIVTLTGISLIDANGIETPLNLVNRDEAEYNISTFGKTSGTPMRYDKIADNIVRLDYKPAAADVSKYSLKYYFQRTGSYFTDADTTKTPGVSPLLHKGFWVNAAYDIADTLGLANLSSISRERDLEIQKVKNYFSIRNQDNAKPVMTMKKILFI